jgi:hypothetical protein
VSEILYNRIKQIIKKFVCILMHIAPKGSAADDQQGDTSRDRSTHLKSSFSFLSFSTNARGDTVPLSAGLAAIWIKRERRAEKSEGGNGGMTGPTLTIGAGVGALVVL